MNSKIFILTALPCEARPVVARFGLKKEMAYQAFSIYRNAEYCLAVTGLGKIAMAAGTAYTLALMNQCVDPVLLNIGVAGHRSHSLGEFFLAEKITDADSGRNYYPQLVCDIPCPSASFLTVSRPHDQYATECLYDMEASAFYDTAARFTTGELIQSLKVISDNEYSPAQNIQPKKVAEWIDGSLDVLEKLMDEMWALQRQIEIVEPEFYRYALTKWHFTKSEQSQLRSALQRWEVLTEGKNLAMDESEMKTGEEVIRWLQQQVKGVDFDLA